MKKKRNVKLISTYAAVLAALAVVAVLMETGALNRQMQTVVILGGINIILALSLNLMVGFLGELTLGHAGFMAAGAYSGCLLSIQLQEVLPTVARLPVCMIVGGLVAACFGILIGIPTLRLRGDYLAIVTLAFGEIIRSIINNMKITGGAGGLTGIPRDIKIKTSQYLIVFAVLLITLIVVTNLTNSRHGRAITAIRDNRIAAESVGINITYHKLLAFVIAAFFAGVAGVLSGHFVGTLYPTDYTYNLSIEILVMVVLGRNTIIGSIIAATLITALPELFREFSDYRMLAYAVVLILMMLLNASPQLAAVREKLRIRRLISAFGPKKAREY